MKKLLFSNRLSQPMLSVALLLLRCTVALMMMLGHGLPKLQHFQEKQENFPVPSAVAGWMSPTISLGLVVFAEVMCCGLLVLGLASRFSAFVLAVVMGVAAFVVHAGDPMFYKPGMAGGSKELALMYFIPAVFLLLTGAGSISLDATLTKEKRRVYR